MDIAVGSHKGNTPRALCQLAPGCRNSGYPGLAIQRDVQTQRGCGIQRLIDAATPSELSAVKKPNTQGSRYASTLG